MMPSRLRLAAEDVPVLLKLVAQNGAETFMKVRRNTKWLKIKVGRNPLHTCSLPTCHSHPPRSADQLADPFGRWHSPCSKSSTSTPTGLSVSTTTVFALTMPRRALASSQRTRWRKRRGAKR